MTAEPSNDFLAGVTHSGSYSPELSHLFTVHLQATELKSGSKEKLLSRLILRESIIPKLRSSKFTGSRFHFKCLAETFCAWMEEVGHVMEWCIENAKSIGICRGKRDKGTPFGTSGVFWMQCVLWGELGDHHQMNYWCWKWNLQLLHPKSQCLNETKGSAGRAGTKGDGFVCVADMRCDGNPLFWWNVQQLMGPTSPCRKQWIVYFSFMNPSLTWRAQIPGNIRWVLCPEDTLSLAFHLMCTDLNLFVPLDAESQEIPESWTGLCWEGP